MDMGDKIGQVVQAAISEQIVGALDGPRRDAILVKAVTAVLQGWELKRVVEKIVHERAQQKAEEIIASGTYDAQIAAEIDAGIASVIARLCEAAKQTLIDALCGREKEGSYDGAKVGLMLKYLSAKA